MARQYRADPDSRFRKRDQLADLDDVKRMVAAAVQHAIVTGEDRPELTGRPDEVVRVTGEAVSALVTMVRVKLDNGTERTFQVQVSETAG